MVGMQFQSAFSPYNDMQLSADKQLSAQHGTSSLVPMEYNDYSWTWGIRTKNLGWRACNSIAISNQIEKSRKIQICSINIYFSFICLYLK